VKPPEPPPAPEIPLKALHLSPLRLFGVLVIFLLLASYAVWNSESTQDLVVPSDVSIERTRGGAHG